LLSPVAAGQSGEPTKEINMLFQPRVERRSFSPFQALQEIQAEFERMLAAPDVGRSSSMAFALYTRDDGLLLRTPLPGVESKDLTLEVDGQTLTLAGRHEDEPEMAESHAQHVERPRGSFTRTLRLPFEIDAARVQAKLERGVLEVVLPRLVKNPPIKIQVLPEGTRN
jgi:HSP20 family protein